MVPVDRSFVATEETTRRSALAGVLAWHRTPRALPSHLLWVAILVSAVFLRPVWWMWIVLLLAPAVEFVAQVRKARKSSRQQFPLGSEVYLGFGDDAMALRSPNFGGELHYSCVKRAITVAGCVVIDAPSHQTFWGIPADLIPSEAVEAMRRGGSSSSGPSA